MPNFKCEEDGTEFSASGPKGYCPECGRRANEVEPEDPPTPDADSNDDAAESGNDDTTEGAKEGTVSEPKNPPKKSAKASQGSRNVVVKKKEPTGNPPVQKVTRISKPKAGPVVTKKVVTNKDIAKNKEADYDTTWSRIRRRAGF